MIKDKNKFNFFVPAEFIKGGKDGKTMYIKGVASSEVEDSDGETLVPAGYDLSPLLATGFLNYNHQANKDPNAIIGEPTKAEIINNGKDLYIEGFFYPDSDLAIKTYELAKTLEKNSPNRRMGFSIEGKALEKDPLNPKRITKARITGVAVTPCPKNPNTLMSIMKGEYAEPFVDLDDEAEEVDKAITAAAGEGVTQKEDVEGGKKTLDCLIDEKKKEEKILQKSETYSLIISKYTDFIQNDLQKAKQIYGLIQEINTKKYGMENTNKGEVLSKALQDAFVLIDTKMEEITKSENTEITDVTSEKEIAKSEAKVEEVEISKSEDETSETENKVEEIEKSDSVEEIKTEDIIVKSENNSGLDAFVKSLIKEQLEKGIDQEAIVADLVSKGIESDFSSNLVKSVADEMSHLEANGGLSEDGLKTEKETVPESKHSPKSPSNPISKSEDNEILKGELIESFEKSQNVLIEQLESRFVALGTILKSQSEEISSTKEILTLLKQENTDLKKSLSEANTKIENFASQPQVRKAITSQSQIVERFPSIQKSESGKEMLSIKKAQDVKILTDKLTQQFDIQKSQGNHDAALANAIFELSVAKTLGGNTLSRVQNVLNGLNIEVVD